MKTLFVAIALSFSLAACAGASSIQGDWSNQEVEDVKLRITPDAMQVSSGPMTLTFKYKIVSSEGKKVMAELNDGVGHKDTATLVIEGDTLHITGHAGVNGLWKRIR